MSTLASKIAELNQKFKQDIVSTGFNYEDYDRIPFTSATLNYMTYGGLPRNCLIEFAGKPGSGKSTLALDIAKNTQKILLQEWEDEVESLQKATLKKDKERLEYLIKNGERKVLYVDAENSLHPWWSKKLGLDSDKMIIIKLGTQSAEEVFEMVIQLVSTGDIGLAIIDSTGVLMSGKLLEGEIGTKEYGGIAMELSNFSKKMTQLCRIHRFPFIGINQYTTDLNAMFNKDKKKGGQGWAYLTSIQISLRGDTDIDEEGRDTGKRNYETPSGKTFKAHLDKSKVFQPNRKLSSFTISFEHGIDSMADLIEQAMIDGLIVQTGAWFSIYDPDTGEEVDKVHGKHNLRKSLEENEELTRKIEKYLYDKYRKS